MNRSFPPSLIHSFTHSRKRHKPTQPTKRTLNGQQFVGSLCLFIKKVPYNQRQFFRRSPNGRTIKRSKLLTALAHFNTNIYGASSGVLWPIEYITQKRFFGSYRRWYLPAKEKMKIAFSHSYMRSMVIE